MFVRIVCPHKSRDRLIGGPAPYTRGRRGNCPDSTTHWAESQAKSKSSLRRADGSVRPEHERQEYVVFQALWIYTMSSPRKYTFGGVCFFSLRGQMPLRHAAADCGAARPRRAGRRALERHGSPMARGGDLSGCERPGVGAWRAAAGAAGAVCRDGCRVVHQVGGRRIRMIRHAPGCT